MQDPVNVNHLIACAMSRIIARDLSLKLWKKNRSRVLGAYADYGGCDDRYLGTLYVTGYTLNTAVLDDKSVLRRKIVS